MKRIVVLLIGGLFLASPAAWADTETKKVSCVSIHTFFNNNAQIRWAFFGFSNHDLENPATIERITFRDRNGVVLYDQGPNVNVEDEVGAPAFGTLGVTPVPPGRLRGVNTVNLFGDDPPGRGPLLAEVEWSKEGDEDLFVVRSIVITFEAIPDGGGGIQRGDFMTVNGPPCVEVEIDD